jgi:hypothetical protein
MKAADKAVKIRTDEEAWQRIARQENPTETKIRGSGKIVSSAS